jgi:hypothetical protein
MVVAAFIIAAAVYIFVKAVVFVGDDVVAIVTDTEYQIIGLLKKGVNVVPQALFHPVRVTYIPLYGSCKADIIVPIPPLEKIKSKNYSITVPVSIQYTFDAGKLKLDLKSMHSNADYVKEIIIIALVDAVNTQFRKYLVPVYQYFPLQANFQNEFIVVINTVKEVCAKRGLVVDDVKIGNVYLPDYAIYAEGKRFLQELLQQEKDNALQLARLQQKLNEDGLASKQRLEHLEKISELIQKNKDILRYIYIDKLADNVRVIVTSDKEAQFDILNTEDYGTVKRDVDNFKK